ncbi:MAG: serine/threonine-protein kinase [Myxococcaceae bacterium]
MQDVTPPGPISFGQYKLIRRIGAGGMGEVFLARDEAALPPRACVVKKVLPHLAQNPSFIGRFLDEAKVVVNLSHPNIARVYAMGQVDGHYYLSMEYVQGKTVSRFMHRLRQRNQELSVGLILLMGERMCQGLAYAHDATDSHHNPLLLVHRDLSPANVCVSYRGEVKIIDFGAAQSTLKEEQTAPRVVIGNLAYMAPEQAMKQFVDRRADVYSAGAVLWELLAWKLLPQKGDPIERWRKAAYPEWEPPSMHRPSVPAEVDQAVLKALAREARDRYPDAAAFGAELRRLRERLEPEADDKALADLLQTVFAPEKATEDATLAEITRSTSPFDEDETTTVKVRRNLVIPPTALAFEHSAISAPSGFHPLEEKDMDPGPRRPRRRRKRRDTVSEATVGFGVSLDRPRFDPMEVEDEPPPPYMTEGAFAPQATLPSWLLYSGAFLGALGVGFAAVWILGR